MPAAPLPSNAPDLPLRDIHLPDAVSWWPIAPGWWMLLAAIIVLIVAVIFGRQLYKQKQINREIRSELDSIQDNFRQHQNKVMLARQLSELLRRVSLSFYEFENPAGLTGEAWLAFLKHTHHDRNAPCAFDDAQAKALILAPYLASDSQVDFDEQVLTALCRSWLLQKHGQQHRLNHGRKHGLQYGHKSSRQHEHQQAGQAE